MTRAAAEWALINKVLAPVNFPLKMWIAHKGAPQPPALAQDERGPGSVDG